ncbi:MAG TPA: DUF1236 domain-containing protein, partial [Pseudolabrys sp.]|nr:DUF1236 domain-containing protein [Pseudolabrys sp.]
TRLLSTVATALLLTVGVASAQTMNKDEAAPTRAPAAQQKAPAEKVAPAMKPGEQKAGVKPSQTTGQAPDADSPRASDKGAMDKDAKEKDKGTTGKTMEKGPTAAGSPAAKSPTTAQTPAPADSKSSQSTTSEKSSTTGQGAAAGSAKLSTEQHSKITSIIKQQKVERVEPAKLNISISVGTRVPTSVRFYPLPREVFVIYPEWRGYDYILVGDQILVINPRTHEIVAILEA